MIPFVCAQCGGKLEVPEEYIGQKIRCPSCATISVVHSARAPREAPEALQGQARKTDDAAAALEASWRPHGPTEKAVPGIGGTKQYDLASVVGPSATGPSAPEAAPQPESAAKPGEPPAAEAAPPKPAGGPPPAAPEGPPEPSESQPLIAQPVAAASPSGPAVSRLPRYLGVRVMGIFYIVCGLVCWLIGLAVLVVLVVGGLQSGDMFSIVASGGLGLTIAVGLFILGLLQVGMGQLFLCVRDLARNSFRLRKL